MEILGPGHEAGRSSGPTSLTGSELLYDRVGELRGQARRTPPRRPVPVGETE